MKVLLTKNELGDMLGCDGRTAVTRNRLSPDAILLSRGKEILLYSLDKARELLARQQQVSYSVNSHIKL
jgi:hypothetical protein